MSTRTAAYIAQWWRDLPDQLRAFLLSQADIEQPPGVPWDSLSRDEQNRVMVAARLMFRDLKPASWL